MKKAISVMLLSMILLSCVSVSAFAQDEYAVVYNTSYLNLREQPDSSSRWLGRADQGQWVKIISSAGNGWYYCEIVQTAQRGYMAGNFLTTQSSASSGGPVTGVVNNPVPTQFLNLRQFPSYEAPVLGIFYNGAACRILASQNGWYLVEINGMQGYFRNEFIRVNSGQGTAVVQTGNSGRLNLRNAPSMNRSGIISKLYNGTQVDVLLKGQQFWKVRANGLVGYVDSKFLRTTHHPVNPEVPKTKGYVIVNNPRPTQYLNLRAQPSASSKVLAQYKNGIRLEVIAQGEEWCKVYGKASGNIGYVMTRFVKTYGLPYSPVKTVINGSTFVNLRSAPSKATGAVYQRVYSGNQVTVLSPGEEWSKVRYGNTVGYMMTCFLK